MNAAIASQNVMPKIWLLNRFRCLAFGWYGKMTLQNFQLPNFRIFTSLAGIYWYINNRDVRTVDKNTANPLIKAHFANLGPH